MVKHCYDRVGLPIFDLKALHPLISLLNRKSKTCPELRRRIGKLNASGGSGWDEWFYGRDRLHSRPYGSCVSLSASSLGSNPSPDCSVNVTVPRDGFGGSRKIISPVTHIGT